MKKFLFGVLVLVFCSIFPVNAFEAHDTNEIYSRQLRAIEGDKIFSELPQEPKKMLENIGIKKVDLFDIAKLDLKKVLNEVIKIGKRKSVSPVRSLSPILAVILVVSILKFLKISPENSAVSTVMDCIGTVCLCTALISPIVSFIYIVSTVIQSAARFTLAIVPIISGIMLALGHTMSATSYHVLVGGAGQIVLYISLNWLVPVLNALLGISLISSVSSKINLSGFCDEIRKIIKSFLKTASSLFVGILTLQNLVGNSADSLGANTVKLTIDSCVPIVGGAISDAFLTIRGCLKLLKVGVGAFGIIAGGAIFLPVIIECFFWIFYLSVCKSAADILEVKKISGLLNSVRNTISLLLAILLFSIVVLLVSVAVVLIIGR
ncbi:MAG: hypothetical protein ACI4PR_00840 [Acutalibacteraceae bacterium]